MKFGYWVFLAAFILLLGCTGNYSAEKQGTASQDANAGALNGNAQAGSQGTGTSEQGTTQAGGAGIEGQGTSQAGTGSQDSGASNEDELPSPPSEDSSLDQAPKTYTVEITDEGYTPKELRIKAGDTVIFLNKGTLQNWPASAKHPTHEVYPEPGGCISSKFDACKGLEPGENFTFTFDQKGEWGYHEHLYFKMFGKIIVE